jgi:hypothetical protein
MKVTQPSADTDSPRVVQLPNWTISRHKHRSCSSVTQLKIPWHRQPSCSSVTQLKNPLKQTVLLQFSYPTEQSPDTNTPPAVQLPDWTIPWHRQPSCSSVTQLNNHLPQTALLQFSYPTEQSSDTDSPPTIQLPNPSPSLPLHYPRSFISNIVFLLPCLTNSQ